MIDLKNSWNGKTALITGASSGIGAATARRLAKSGLKVTLVARREERLNNLAESIRAEAGQAQVITEDLNSEAGRQRLYTTVMQSHGCPDVLVNNAGFGWYGFTSDMDWHTAREMIEVNIAALVQLTLQFLPEMCLRQRGHILNISSIAGSLPNQGIAVYAGSKSFIDSFTTALYRELRYTPIWVTAIRPGPVRTEFFDSAQQLPSGGRVPAERFSISPERVAEGIWFALNHPRRVLYIPWYLGVSPWLELIFGGLIDQLGPLLLRQNTDRKLQT